MEKIETNLQIEDIPIKQVDFINLWIRKMIRRLSYLDVSSISDPGFELLLRESCEYIEHDFWVVATYAKEDIEKAMEAFRRDMANDPDLANYKVEYLNEGEISFWLAYKIFTKKYNYRDLYNDNFEVTKTLFVIKK